MTDYDRHFQQRGLSQYVWDGAINPAKWAVSRVKVLFLLKENWGYQDFGKFKIGDEAHDWLGAKNRTYRKCVPLAGAIEMGLQRGHPLSPDEIISLMSNDKLLHEILDRIAVVNIKKHSGWSKSNDSEIRREAGLNRSILKAQLLEHSPTVIIAGGSVCWHSLIYDVGLFETVPECPKHDAVTCNNIILCYANHPSAWSGGGFDVNALHRAILKQAWLKA